MKIEYVQRIFKKILKFMKMRPVGADLFHKDRRTDMAKLIIAFAQFWEKRLISAGIWNLRNAKWRDITQNVL